MTPIKPSAGNSYAYIFVKLKCNSAPTFLFAVLTAQMLAAYATPADVWAENHPCRCNRTPGQAVCCTTSESHANTLKSQLLLGGKACLSVPLVSSVLRLSLLCDSVWCWLQTEVLAQSQSVTAWRKSSVRRKLTTEWHTLCSVLICVFVQIVFAVPNGANIKIQKSILDVYTGMWVSVRACIFHWFSLSLWASAAQMLLRSRPAGPLFLSCCYAQRHLGDALTKRAPNECGKWEYQFDELCYSISAINFPVAPPSKMESRMIESLLHHLILACETECAEGRGSEEKRILCSISFSLRREKIYCILACSVHNSSFGLISSKLILFTSDLAWTELQIKKIILNRKGNKSLIHSNVIKKERSVFNIIKTWQMSRDCVFKKIKKTPEWKCDISLLSLKIC